MSTTKKIVLIVVSVLLVCLIGMGIILGVSYGKNGGESLFSLFKAESVYIDESADLDLTGVDTINVACASGRIHIVSGEPSVHLTGSVFTSRFKEGYLSVSNDGSTLTVKFDSDAGFLQVLSADVTLNVALPEDVLANLHVSGASADTDISGLSLRDVSIDNASGATYVTGCTGGQLDIDVASGGIQVNDSGFESVAASCISGDVSVENVTGPVSASSTSGTVRVSNITGGISVSNTSGSVFVTQEQKDIGAIHVDVISGGVEIKLNPDAAFDLSAESTSGGFSTDFDITVSGSMSNKVVGSDVSGKVGGGGPLIDLSTVSGGIHVLKTSE